MQENFTKEDLKVGMLVEINYGKYHEDNLAILFNTKEGLCVSCGTDWFFIDELNENLIYNNAIINKVYSIANHPKYACRVSTEDRQLLWERKEEPEYMTFWEARKYKYMKYKDMKEYINTPLEKEFVFIRFEYLKDLDKKVWLGTNKI